jgi:hypothetical protein
MTRPASRLLGMLLGIALTPVVWIVILVILALGGVAVRRAGPHGWWVLAGIAALLAVTNPSSTSHNDALRRELRSTLRQAIDREANGAGRIASAAFQRLGGDAVLDLLLDVEHQNFILFSRATMDGDVVSVGLLGNVFVQHGLPRNSHRRARSNQR